MGQTMWIGDQLLKSRAGVHYGPDMVFPELVHG